MQPFTAFRIHQQDGRIAARFEPLRLEQLSPGDVVVRVTHSGINYKDALAATGAGRILRRYPLVGGIDLAGVVAASSDPAVREGDAVLVAGTGLSETRDGGYAQYARVPGDAIVPLPVGLDAASAMGIGTAGFTAALALLQMEHNGQSPAQGPVLVTGASGGVGSLAIDMLATRGYHVVALTGKSDASDYLQSIGAAEVLLRDQLPEGGPPLASARWAGAIDNLGGGVLAAVLAAIQPLGNVASIGLAAGSELHTTVMPFILRGVRLLGINSSAADRATRLAVWERVAGDLRPRHLAQIVTRTITLAELPEAFAGYLAGRVQGRTVVLVP